MPTFKINKHNGGIADDRFVGATGSHQEIKGIEIRKHPATITLAPKLLTEDSAGTITEHLRAFVTIKSTGDVIGFGTSTGTVGRIYARPKSSTTWTLVHETTPTAGNETIFNAFEYNGNLYWTTQNQLHKIAVSSISNNSTWTGVTDNFKTFTAGNLNQHPMVELNNKLYIGDGSNLAELDSAEVFTGAKITIFGDEEIRALTVAGSSIHIYARRTPLNADGHPELDRSRAYLWDGSSNGYNQIVPWDDVSIEAVVNKNGIDYVLAGRPLALYASSGLQRNLLKLIDRSDGESNHIRHNGMVIHEDKVFFALRGSTTGTGSTQSTGIYSWGALNQSYPNVLGHEAPTQTVGGTIKSLHSSNGELIFPLEVSGVLSLHSTDTTKYATSGHIISKVFTGGDTTKQKSIKEMAMTFVALNAGEKIDVFIRKDLETSWGTAVATVDQSVSADQGIVNKRFLDSLTDQDFYMLEVKIELTAGTSNATTPEFIELSIDYNIIEQ